MLPQRCHILGPWAASAYNDGDNDICDDRDDADMIYVIMILIYM